MIQGKSTGMDTPTILFATLAGGSLMGIYGLLLAIPLAACLKILLQELFWPRFQEWIAGKRPDFSADQQRLMVYCFIRAARCKKH